jgi:hypothetical protein
VAKAHARLLVLARPVASCGEYDDVTGD